MSVSYTVSESRARELAGKVASDLQQFSRFYSEPSRDQIPKYLDELEVLLENGYVREYKFGFRRRDAWVLCYAYTVRGGVLVGGRPGGIEPGCDISDASYYNYLIYSDAWWRLGDDARRTLRDGLPIQRGGASEPGFEGGTWFEGRVYGAGGVEMARRMYRA